MGSTVWNKGYVWGSRINIRDTKTLIIPENKDERTAIGRVRKYYCKSYEIYRSWSKSRFN